MGKRCAAAVLLVGAALAVGGCADSPDASPPPLVPASPTVSASPTLSASPDAQAATPTVTFCRSVGATLGDSKLPAALLDLQRSGVEAVDALTKAAADTADVLAGIERPPALDTEVAARASDLESALTDVADVSADDPADTLTGTAIALTRSIGAFTESCATS